MMKKVTLFFALIGLFMLAAATTPNMTLVTPTVGVTSGPTWATMLNTAFGLIDSHDHSAGKGVAIGVLGLDIDGELALNGENISEVNSMRLVSQVSELVSGADVRSIYSVDGELYYNDASGTSTQITDGGSLNASLIGGFSGEYSSAGASAIYTDSTKLFTFRRPDLTPGNALVADASLNDANPSLYFLDSNGADMRWAVETGVMTAEYDSASDGTYEKANLVVVDGVNSRVGVLTASPSATLDVTGTALISSTLGVNGTMSANGTFSANSTALFSSTVDISGVTTMQSRLDVNNDIKMTEGTPSVTWSDSTSTADDYRWQADANKFVLACDTNDNTSTFESDNLIVVDGANSRVGINTASPAKTFDITGTFTVSGAATFGSTVAVSSDTYYGIPSATRTHQFSAMYGMDSSLNKASGAGTNNGTAVIFGAGESVFFTIPLQMPNAGTISAWRVRVLATTGSGTYTAALYRKAYSTTVGGTGTQVGSTISATAMSASTELTDSPAHALTSDSYYMIINKPSGITTLEVNPIQVDITTTSIPAYWR